MQAPGPEPGGGERGQAQRDKNQPEPKTTQRPQNGVDRLLQAGGRVAARKGGEAGGVGLSGGKASVSGFLLGAAAGPRAGGSVSAASPGYFIKEEEKK